MSKCVLITGATGFVGANVARKLLEKGYSVHALVRANSDLWRLKGLSSISLHTIQSLKKEEVLPIFQRISPYAVIHCAAMGVRPEERNEDALIKTNIQGTLHLLQAAAACRVERFIHTGSCFEFASNFAPIAENIAPSPQNFYGVSKAASTLLAIQQGKALGVPSIALRLFGLYGPLESRARFLQAVISACMANEGVDTTLGEQVRDYTYIEDVAELYAELVGCDFFPKGEIFHIGSGQPCTIRTFGSIAEKVMQRSGLLRWGALQYRPDEAHFLVSDPRKIQKVLGWRAKTSLEEGIERTIQVARV